MNEPQNFDESHGDTDPSESKRYNLECPRNKYDYPDVRLSKCLLRDYHKNKTFQYKILIYRILLYSILSIIQYITCQNSNYKSRTLYMFINEIIYIVYIYLNSCHHALQRQAALDKYAVHGLAARRAR